MEKFQKVTGRVVPLPMKDIDTDLIIPAQYLTGTGRGGYGEHLFERLRAQDPKLALNDSTLRAAPILLARSNFGCGSSREHAVWALMEWGFKVVIAPSFADIFFSNAAKNGLLLVILDTAIVEDLLSAAQKELSLTIDLETLTITSSNGFTTPFTYDPFRRECLLNGFDDLDYVLKRRNQVAAHFAEKEATRWSLPTTKLGLKGVE